MSHELAGLGDAPILFANTWAFEPTAEMTVTTMFERSLIESLAIEVLRQDFSSARALERLPGAIESQISTAIAQAAEGEEDSPHHPVRDLLGRSALRNTVAADFRLPTAFVDGIAEQIAVLQPDIFEPLEAHHEIIERTGYLELTRNVQTIIDAEAENWADDVFALAHDAAVNRFDSFAVPEGQEAALSLICFLPYQSRGLTRRLITNSTLFKQFERSLGPELSDEERSALAAVREYLIADIITGQQWTELPIGDQSMEIIGLTDSDTINQLSIIQRIARAGRGKRIASMWRLDASLLDRATERASADHGLSDWESVDYGHCFKHFAYYDLLDAFADGSFRNAIHDTIPDKDGTRAVILEDDSEQMRVWQQMINDYFPQETGQELCFVTPDGVAETAADPANTLFLLDIQNDKDLTAGIRVAEAILRQRYAMLEAAGFDQSAVTQTEIIVWSNSKRALQLATNHFTPILETMRDVRQSLHGGSRGGLGSAKINLKVRPKGLKIGDLPLVRLNR